MAKFSTSSTSFGKPVTKESRTHEGGQGYVRDPKSDLFLLAVTNFVAEDTFYETAQNRDARFEKLVHQVVQDDPEWVARFVPWLRNVAQMRSASVVMAAEYLRAGGPNSRRVIASAVSRADEPMELLGYWLSKYGRRMPMAFKRGIADACVRVFNEKTVLKYDGAGRDVRMADVLDLCHPKPKDNAQSALFNMILNRRHGKPLDLSQLATLRKAADVDAVPEQDRRNWLRQHGADGLAEAGYTWERLGGWLPGGWDAEAWEKMIPSMGYMALLRNLRNFDRHNISEASRLYVRTKLSDKGEVERSRQFPFRFLSAHKATDTHNWTATIEAALDHSCQNIPDLPGSTLVLVDVSGSMTATLTRKSSVQRMEAGALFGAVLARRTGSARLIAFGTESAEIPFTPQASVLKMIEKVYQSSAKLGWGTNLNQAIAKHWNGEDRIVMFTDMQTHDFANKNHGAKFVHGFNLAGYATSAVDTGQSGRFEYGGFTDATFKLMPLLEAFDGTSWPF